jgi:hypothetical protein
LAVRQDGSDGLGDIGIRKAGGGQLVEKRLKKVMILAIDQGDFRPVAWESLAKRQPAKSRSYDDDAGPAWNLLRVGG